MRVYASFHPLTTHSSAKQRLSVWGLLKHYYRCYTRSRHAHHEMLEWLANGR